MKKLMTICVIVLLAIAAQSQANTTVINFDDLTTTESWSGTYGTMYYGVIPQSYDGYIWTPQGEYGWNVGSGTAYQSAYRNFYGAVSADNFAYNSGLAVVSVGGSPFNFIGADVSTWAQDNQFVGFSATSVTATGLLGNTVVGTVTMPLSSTGFNWLTANFMGIDKLDFTTNSSSGYFIMDNVTVSSTIPAPGAILLGSIGVGFVGWLRKRRTL